MNIKIKSAFIGVLAAAASVTAGISQTIFPYFHYLYVDFATSTVTGHSTYDTDSGSKYMNLALNGNACYDIKLEGGSGTTNPDLIFKIWTSSGEQTLDDDGPGHLQPQALLWITEPTYLKVRAYSSYHNNSDFAVYSYINSSVTTASDCKNLDSDRPFYNGSTYQIERSSNSSD